MDASLLRWILLVIGLLVILGVYLAGLHQVRMRKQAQIENFTRGDDPLDILDVDLHRELQNLDAVVKEDSQAVTQESVVSPSLEIQAEEKPAPIRAPQAAAVESRTVAVPRSLRRTTEGASVAMPSRDLILFYLKSVSGEPVRLRFLIQILQNSGLEYGERQMYHFVDCNQILFSVAALTDDGVLDPGQAPNTTLPGVVCYMKLAQESQPQRAFEKMLQVIDFLVRGLEFKVYKPDWRLLTVDDVRNLRNKLKEDEKLPGA